jgi:hypothetical protein
MKEAVKTDSQYLLMRDNKDRKSIDGKLERFVRVLLHTGGLDGEVIYKSIQVETQSV